MMTWEYHTELLKGTTHQVRAQMNTLGEQGWECFAIIGSMAYFRRGFDELVSAALRNAKGNGRRLPA